MLQVQVIALIKSTIMSIWPVCGWAVVVLGLIGKCDPGKICPSPFKLIGQQWGAGKSMNEQQPSVTYRE